MSVVQAQVKKCSKCQVVQAAHEFYRDKSTTSGLAKRCKGCERVREKARPSRIRPHRKARDSQRKTERPEEYKAKKREQRLRRKQLVQYRIDKALSEAIRRIFRAKGLKKDSQWRQTLGYLPQDLMSHLEARFTEEMNWSNYGIYWHIDHIVPKSWFKYESVEDEAFKKCWSLDNLQPLEARANVRKGARFVG